MQRQRQQLCAGAFKVEQHRGITQAWCTLQAGFAVWEPPSYLPGVPQRLTAVRVINGVGPGSHQHQRHRRALHPLQLLAAAAAAAAVAVRVAAVAASLLFGGGGAGLLGGLQLLLQNKVKQPGRRLRNVYVTHVILLEARVADI